MFDLVDRVELYPQFLPWCAAQRCWKRGRMARPRASTSTTHGVRAHFTTDNANRPGESIVVTLRDGPFRHLHGEWRFTELAPDGCKVAFALAYEFAAPLLERVVGPVFNHIAHTFTDAFVRRAEQSNRGARERHRRLGDASTCRISSRSSSRQARRVADAVAIVRARHAVSASILRRCEYAMFGVLAAARAPCGRGPRRDPRRLRSADPKAVRAARARTNAAAPERMHGKARWPRW